VNAQIYLLLVRKVNPDLPWAMKVPLFLKNFVMGDSLDAPFMKFIRVQSVSHSIEFGGGQSVTQKVAGQNKAETFWTEGHTSDGEYDDRSAHMGTSPTFGITGDSRWDKVKSAGKNVGKYAYGLGFSQFDATRNNFTKTQLPGHGEFTFTKFIDNSTPQLAYGCSAQEPFYFAGFFFRRRIGMGVSGVRWPYLGIGLTKCLITGWSLSNDTETVTLKYKHIMWGTFDQLADYNVPTGFSYRVWNSDEKSGGEKPAGLGIQALVTALMAGTGAIVGAAGGFSDGITDGEAP